MAVVAEGSYLILARPRSRTAWLAGLLFSDIPCYHDEPQLISRLIQRGQPFGMSAPSLPMMDLEYIADVYAHAPVVVIDRPAQRCYDSLSGFIGLPFPQSNVDRFESRFQALVDRLAGDRQLSIPYVGLEEFETVNRIHLHCLGRPLDPERFHVFNMLRVEQHLPKVMDNAAALLRRS
jgi:hypothetical protein